VIDSWFVIDSRKPNLNLKWSNVLNNTEIGKPGLMIDASLGPYRIRPSADVIRQIPKDSYLLFKEHRRVFNGKASV